MTQEIRTFRADTMDEAMDLVRRELGNEAVVLESKPIERRRLLPWQSTSQQVEVLAQPRSHKPALVPIPARKGTLIGQQKLRSLAEMQSVKENRSTLLRPIPELPIETLNEDRLAADHLAQPPAWVSPATTSQAASSVSTSGHSHRKNEPTAKDEQPLSAIVDQQQLTSLETIVSRLERHAGPKSSRDVPHEFYPYYLKLVEADVDDEIARELISQLRMHPSAQSAKAANAMLMALIEREMRCAPPIRPQPGRREIVMAVGPTGVGKTTTLAKLAGHFQLREGLRVGLITVDTYRVGAIEQLQSYADILRAPLRTAASPGELRTAIDELDDVDLILIDTAGRSPCDNPKLDELRDLVEVSAADHVMLVLSLTSSSRRLSEVAERFSSASPTSLILTKLDEVPGHGELLSVARDVAYPVSYFTTGQDVPDQIEPAHPTCLARLVLGLETIRQNVDQAMSLA